MLESESVGKYKNKAKIEHKAANVTNLGELSLHVTLNDPVADHV